MCLGITTPIPDFKGRKNQLSPDDFRGITVNPIISNIFEICVSPHLSSLHTSSRQFGFKKHMGTLDAIHMVRKIINYFISRGNTNNLGVIDLKKAFDKANVYGILKTL